MSDDNSSIVKPVGDAADLHLAADPHTSEGGLQGAAAVDGGPNVGAEGVQEEEVAAAGRAGSGSEHDQLTVPAAKTSAATDTEGAEDADPYGAQADAYTDADAHEDCDYDDRSVASESVASPQRIDNDLLREDSIIDEYGYERTRSEMSGRKLDKGIDTIRRQREWWAAEFPGGIVDERLAQKWRKRAVELPPSTTATAGSSGSAATVAAAPTSGASGGDGALPPAPGSASKPSRLLQGLSDAAAAATTKLRQVPDAKSCLSCGQGTVKPEREACKICGARHWGPPLAPTSNAAPGRRRSFAEHQNLDDSRDGSSRSGDGDGGSTGGGGGSGSGGSGGDFPPVGGAGAGTTKRTSSIRHAPPNKADGEALTRAIRMGVPPELREAVWLRCSGALAKKRAALPEDSYANVLKRAEENKSAVAAQIEKDLRRTLPTNTHFQKEEGIDALRCVLLAYAERNSALGYCQSMNFICAILLLHMECDDVFWCLAALVEDVLPPHWFDQDLHGSRVEPRVLLDCVQWKLPKLWRHMQNLGMVEMNMFENATYPWFLSLFTASLPLEPMLRAWDCFFHEGIKALQRVAMGLLWLRQDEILGMTDELEIFELLKSPSVALFSGNDQNASGYGGGGSSSGSSSSASSLSGNGEEGNQTGQLRFATAFTADALFSAAYKMKTDVPLPRTSRRIFPASNRNRRASTSFSSSNGGSNSSLDRGSGASSSGNSTSASNNSSSGARRRSFMMPSMSPFRRNSTISQGQSALTAGSQAGHSGRGNHLVHSASEAAAPHGATSAPWDYRPTSEDRDGDRHLHHHHSGSGHSSSINSPRLGGVDGFMQGGAMSFDSASLHMRDGPRSPLSDGSVNSDDGHEFSNGGGGGALRSPMQRLGGGANRPLPTIFSQTFSGDETFDSSNLSRASSSHASSSGGHHSGNSPLSSSLEGLGDVPESPHENVEEGTKDEAEDGGGEVAGAGAMRGDQEGGVCSFPVLHPITEGAEAHASREDTSGANSVSNSIDHGSSSSSASSSSRDRSTVASPAMHVRSASHENFLLLLSEEDRAAHQRQTSPPSFVPPPPVLTDSAATGVAGGAGGGGAEEGPESPGAAARTRILCTRTSSLSSFASDSRPTSSQSFDASASSSMPRPPPSPHRGWGSQSSSSSVGRGSSSSPMRPFGSHHQQPPQLHLQHSHNSDAASSGLDSASTSSSSFASFSFANNNHAVATPGSGGSGGSGADWGQSSFRARIGSNSGGSFHSSGGGGGGDNSNSRGPSFITGGGGGASRAGSGSRPSSLDRHSNLSPGGSVDHSEGTGGSRARGSGHGWGMSSDRGASSSVTRGRDNDLGEGNEATLMHGVPPWQSCMGHFPNKQLEKFRASHLEVLQERSRQSRRSAEQWALQEEVRLAAAVATASEAAATPEAQGDTGGGDKDDDDEDDFAVMADESPCGSAMPLPEGAHGSNSRRSSRSNSHGVSNNSPRGGSYKGHNEAEIVKDNGSDEEEEEELAKLPSANGQSSPRARGVQSAPTSAHSSGHASSPPLPPPPGDFSPIYSARVLPAQPGQRLSPGMQPPTRKLSSASSSSSSPRRSPAAAADALTSADRKMTGSPSPKATVDNKTPDLGEAGGTNDGTAAVAARNRSNSSGSSSSAVSSVNPSPSARTAGSQVLSHSESNASEDGANESNSSDFFDSDAPLQGTRTSTSDANLPTNTKRRNSYSQGARLAAAAMQQGDLTSDRTSALLPPARLHHSAARTQTALGVLFPNGSPANPSNRRILL